VTAFIERAGLDLMGWSFLSLVNYKGGGPDALIEPLAGHRNICEAHLAPNFGAGVRACYRGSRLYDTEASRCARDHGRRSEPGVP
jgi:hypothetical protein